MQKFDGFDGKVAGRAAAAWAGAAAAECDRAALLTVGGAWSAQRAARDAARLAGEAAGAGDWHGAWGYAVDAWRAALGAWDRAVLLSPELAGRLAVERAAALECKAVRGRFVAARLAEREVALGAAVVAAAAEAAARRESIRAAAGESIW